MYVGTLACTLLHTSPTTITWLRACTPTAAIHGRLAYAIRLLGVASLAGCGAGGDVGVVTFGETATAMDTGQLGSGSSSHFGTATEQCHQPEYLGVEWSFGWDSTNDTTISVLKDGQDVPPQLNLLVYTGETHPFITLDSLQWTREFNHCTVTFYLDDQPSQSWASDQGLWVGLDGLNPENAWTDCDEWACPGTLGNDGAVAHFSQWNWDLGMGGPITGYLSNFAVPEEHY